MNSIQNDKLKISINKTGAELCEISSVKNGTQFMWNANPDIWGNFAPNLFPIVGMLKDQTYFFEGKKYELSKHGFIRNNPKFQIVNDTNESIILSLIFDEESLKTYPFKFEFEVTYQLIENTFSITYKIVNVDSKSLYFSVGGHPAFKCPVFNNETYSDYKLVFESEETSKTHLLNLQSGLVTNEKKSVFDTENTIRLRYDLFDHDALIFKDLLSRKVTLNSKQNGDILTVHFKDFPFLGIWAKENADFVCIEPWLGIADSDTSNQQLVEKEGIIKLDKHSEFEASYTIEIHEAHLD